MTNYNELVRRLRSAARWADKGLIITPSICLEAADAIEVLSKERKKGKWLLSEFQNKEETDNDNYFYECSCCHFSDLHSKSIKVPYCWFCGAEMESET